MALAHQQPQPTGLPTAHEGLWSIPVRLEAFETTNIIPITLSVATSFIAVYLTFRRSPYFALAYAANDVVLIILWTLAAVEDITYISVLICFVMFLVNDLYGFVNWKRMEKRQIAATA